MKMLGEDHTATTLETPSVEERLKATTAAVGEEQNGLQCSDVPYHIPFHRFALAVLMGLVRPLYLWIIVLLPGGLGFLMLLPALSSASTDGWTNNTLQNLQIGAVVMFLGVGFIAALLILISFFGLPVWVALRRGHPRVDDIWWLCSVVLYCPWVGIMLYRFAPTWGAVTLNVMLILVLLCWESALVWALRPPRTAHASRGTPDEYLSDGPGRKILRTGLALGIAGMATSIVPILGVPTTCIGLGMAVAGMRYRKAPATALLVLNLIGLLLSITWLILNMLYG